ncbi:MAG: Rpn family recombination-promoting nuclease/putative transposase [Eubacteriales bacterium]|nr:Rpn family recombination-promoting nuclease/putative transposase [Eubacteriales bacterium]
MDKRRKRVAGQHKSYHPEAHVKDVDSKMIFKNSVLCSQFLRDHMDIPALKNVKPEDIEDVSRNYRAYLGVEFEADTVKKIRIRNGESTGELFLISLIEYKSGVDYNVTMQIFRYMACIWSDYAARMEKERKGITRQKNFKYPPILPIVYYEGKEEWTAELHLRDRIMLKEVFGECLPDFTYKLVRLHDYSNEELLDREDEISLLMMINRVQTPAELEELLKTEKRRIERIVKGTTEDILQIISAVIWGLCMKMNMAQEDAAECVELVKERNMGYLFENMEKMDIQAERRNTAEARKRAEIAEKKADEAEKKAEEAAQKLESMGKRLEESRKYAQEIERKVQENRSIIVAVAQKFGASKGQAAEQLAQALGLGDEEAEAEVNRYWK